jgi:hypothetical protein
LNLNRLPLKPESAAVQAVFLCKHSLSGEYLVIAVASSAPPILNPSALIQRRFAKIPVATPALAIMNLTVLSFPPTLRFITDLLSNCLRNHGCRTMRPRCPRFASRIAE